MRSKHLSLIMFCVTLAVVPALGAEKKSEKPMDPRAMMEAFKKLGRPGEPHKLFATLEGSWTTRTKSWMDDGQAPVESTGSAEMKMLLGGRFLQQEFTGEMMGQPFSGLGINGYDNLQKRYITAWIDSMGTGIFVMEGTASADGRTITLTGSHPEPGGGQMMHRAVWKLVDANHQTFEMYGTHGHGKEMKMMEISYTRKQ